MTRKPILIDPTREFCGKPIGVYVPKPQEVKPIEQDQKPKTEKRNPVASPLTEGLIRGPSLEVFIPRSSGVTMKEALARATAEKRVIASNKRLSQALVGSKEWETIRAALPCWTGTMIAYDKPDQKLGKTIEYLDSKTKIRYVFPVPEEHQRKKNVLLVAEHPGFTL